MAWLGYCHFVLYQPFLLVYFSYLLKEDLQKCTSCIVPCWPTALDYNKSITGGTLSSWVIVSEGALFFALHLFITSKLFLLHYLSILPAV